MEESESEDELVDESVDEMKQGEKENTTDENNQSMAYCNDLKEFRKSIRKLPICNQDEEPTLNLLEEILKSVHTIYIAKQNLCDGEATFNDFLLYPFLRAVCFSVADSVTDNNIEFKVLTADGIIIKMFASKEVEVALLETSSHFRSQDRAKHSFNHHKGTYGVLAMLKGIADEYHLASADTFSKLKVLFVHAADDKVFLWSNTIYCACISTLKLEHEEQLKKNMFRSTSSITSLKQNCNPSILKLIEEDDKVGMAELGPFYSNPPSPDNQ
ncbi:hypothetical protein BD560DRAFT_452135 [Blakeslea trispora]|nr:hypothetical protein BD560DRAFT_452135 [Blakeslea trispora]